mmetsp:Transcript_11316/g.33686  ORF Transcript_11316/g.33686 Transcript_11316/m.33686 type:complete len:468 (+) Transcript_11316:1656-3059(+)
MRERKDCMAVTAPKRAWARPPSGREADSSDERRRARLSAGSCTSSCGGVPPPGCPSRRREAFHESCRWCRRGAVPLPASPRCPSLPPLPHRSESDACRRWRLTTRGRLEVSPPATESYDRCLRGGATRVGGLAGAGAASAMSASAISAAAPSCDRCRRGAAGLAGERGGTSDRRDAPIMPARPALSRRSADRDASPLLEATDSVLSLSFDDSSSSSSLEPPDACDVKDMERPFASTSSFFRICSSAIAPRASASVAPGLTILSISSRPKLHLTCSVVALRRPSPDQLEKRFSCEPPRATRVSECCSGRSHSREKRLEPKRPEPLYREPSERRLSSSLSGSVRRPCSHLRRRSASAASGLTSAGPSGRRKARMSLRKASLLSDRGGGCPRLFSSSSSRRQRATGRSSEHARVKPTSAESGGCSAPRWSCSCDRTTCGSRLSRRRKASSSTGTTRPRAGWLHEAVKARR